MLSYIGGHKVERGTYWNLARGQRVDIADEGILPGDRGARYFKMSALTVLLIGPLIGLLYAVFLPFIGIAMTVYMILRKIAMGMLRAAVKSSSFGWRPIETYLDGKQRRIKVSSDAGKCRKR